MKENEIFQWATDKLNGNRSINDRMDKDFDIWNQKETKWDTHKTAINITLPDGRLFANEVYAKLIAAEMQIIIRMAEREGVDNRDDVSKQEMLLSFALEQADRRLAQMLLTPLRDSLIWYGLVRGWRSARILVWKDKNGVIFDILPLDRRWLVWDVGKTGLLRVGYITFRSSGEIEEEYGIKPSKGVLSTLRGWAGLPEKDYVVVDFWEGKENTVVCHDNILKKATKHNLRRLPFVIVPVATRPPVVSQGTDTSSGYGDSIFAPNRHIYGIDSRLASVEATHANLLAKQPMINYYDEQGISDLKETINQPEAVLNLPMGHNKLESSPMKEVSVTLLNLREFIESRRRRGELPYLELGTPPASGTALAIVQDAGDRIFGPQLRNLNFFYARMCEMIEEQLIDGGYKVEIKAEDKKKYYSADITPVDLKKPHTIRVEFTATTPWTQMDTYQIADMAKRLGLPDEFVWENILKLADPKRLQGLAAMELAEHSPKFMLLRAIQECLDLKRYDEAKMLIKDLYNMSIMEQGEARGELEPGEAGEDEGTLPLPEEETPIGGIPTPGAA